MPLSKKRDRERKRAERKRAREASLLGVSGIMSPADVRAMRNGGLRPEDIENEPGKVASRLYYAMMRDRDAIKAHLDWLRESGGYNARAAETKRQMAAIKARAVLVDDEWLLKAEAERVVQEATG